VLENFSGLIFNKDFYAGYSPERINPGDKEHTVEKILKVYFWFNTRDRVESG
jgi:UDP-N-acetyl-D-galactosamine dehydrogenase